MATAYKSVEYTANSSPRFVEVGDFEVYAHFALSAAFVINDTIAMCPVPKGARILNIELYVDDLDTNVSPTILFDIGDSLSAARFASAVTLPQSGGFMRGIQTKAGFCYQMTQDDVVTIKINTAPATGAATGDIIMRVTCCVDN